MFAPKLNVGVTMKNTIILISTLLILFGYSYKSFGQSIKKIFPNPLSPRNANYDIEVTLIPETKMLIGKETVKWTNITSQATNELQFHLYLNGFAHNETTYMIESDRKYRGTGKKFDQTYNGFSRLTSIKIRNTELLRKIEFIQPDDNNVFDSTVVRIMLDKPVKPGEAVEIKIDFIAKLPMLFSKTGYSDPAITKGFFFIAQWFPKIGVLEESGWNCHQLHPHTEFFSDYGVYNVTLTTPKKFVIGATGLMVSKVITNDIKTIIYRAEDVHDFAWTAYPNFKEYTENYKGISIRFLYNESYKADVAKQIQSLKYAIDYFEERFGKYPYPNITFLNPPEGSSAAGGMEYPTIFTVGRNGLIPDNLLSIHLVTTIHEFAHQIFYGILGSNEFENAWMDEGMTSFATQRIIDTYYGGHINMQDFSFTNENRDRFKYLSMPNHETILTTSYKQKPSNYGVNSYSKPAILLRTLEKYLGREKFNNGMYFYYHTWKFKHPEPEDFFSAMSQGTGINLSWFFEQFFRDNKTIDYELNQISQKRIDGKFVERGFQCAPNTDLSGKKAIYYNCIVIKNYGNGYFPMELEIMLKDSSIWSSAKWDFKSNYNYIEFYANSPLVRAQLDPERNAVIDLSYSNNGKSLISDDASGKFVFRWLFWAHNIVQFLGGF